MVSGLGRGRCGWGLGPGGACVAGERRRRGGFAGARALGIDGGPVVANGRAGGPGAALQRRLQRPMAVVRGPMRRHLARLSLIQPDEAVPLRAPPPRRRCSCPRPTCCPTATRTRPPHLAARCAPGASPLAPADAPERGAAPKLRLGGGLVRAESHPLTHPPGPTPPSRCLTRSWAPLSRGPRTPSSCTSITTRPSRRCGRQRPRLRLWLPPHCFGHFVVGWGARRARRPAARSRRQHWLAPARVDAGAGARVEANVVARPLYTQHTPNARAGGQAGARDRGVPLGQHLRGGGLRHRESLVLPLQLPAQRRGSRRAPPCSAAKCALARSPSRKHCATGPGSQCPSAAPFPPGQRGL